MSEEAESGRSVSFVRFTVHILLVFVVFFVVSEALHLFAPRDSIFFVKLRRHLDVADALGFAVGYFSRELLDTYYPLATRK